MSSGPGPSASQQSVYRGCIKEAAAQGRALMLRMVRRAVDSLQRRAVTGPNEDERDGLAEAAQALVQHESELCDAYPRALLSEFAGAIAGDPRKAAAVRFDALPDMRDEQLQDAVEFTRLQQQVAAQVQAEFAALAGLVATVQGSSAGQPERNPLRPDVYARSLHTVAMQSPVSSAVRERWMKSLGEALGPELARIYSDLATWLRAHGVSETREAAKPAKSRAPSESRLLNLRELRRLVVGDLSPDAPTERPTQFGLTMPAAMDALEDTRQVELVVERMRARRKGAGSQAPGATPAHDGAQALAQEVVRLMLDRISHDRQLLPPVQECVSALEPAFLRLAQSDPRFFSDRQHPARRLLEESTQRSLAFESVRSPGFDAFIEPLRQAVDVLRETRIRGPEPFDFALKTLEDAWGRMARREREQRERAVKALLNAERRNLVAEKVARGLRQRADLQGAPREVVAFVTGPWSQVIAQAQLGDVAVSADPGGYTAILADLIWSSQASAVSAQPQRLAKLMPRVAEKLRQGLASIDYPREPTERFLGYLAGLQRQVLRGAGADAPAVGAGEIAAMPADGAEAWLAPAEAQDSGFMDSHSALLQAGKAAREVPLARPSLSQFHPGTWFEMTSASGWERFQVTWASPQGTLFMFTGRSGQPQSMTRQLLTSLLQKGALRLVPGHVVERALDAVAEQALRNSLG